MRHARLRRGRRGRRPPRGAPGCTWAFCREACLDAFIAEPAGYVARAEAAAADPAADRSTPDIDEGFRRWYESCACCLSDAYPEIKARLDAERNAAAQPPVDEGICVTAEAAEAPGTLRA